MAGELDISFQIDRRQAALLNHALTALPKQLVPKLRKTIAQTLLEAREWMVSTHLSAPQTTATSLATRSGALNRAMRTYTSISDRDIEGGIFVSADEPAGNRGGTRPYRYAPVHEFGATIRPRRAQYLAIPLNEVAARYRPRDFDLFVIKSKAGNLLLVSKAGDGGLLPMYVLKRSVRIPKRPFMTPTAKKWFPVVFDRMATTVAQMLTKGIPVQ